MLTTQTILERVENNMLKWYGYIVRMEDEGWPENNDLVTGRKTMRTT